jgi:CubicO group peptidase (beta-lactamase class C family)
MSRGAPLDLGQFSGVQGILEQAVRQGAFPGASLAVGYKSELALLSAGKLSYDANATSVSPETIYDLASLTKVVASTAEAMLLVDRGRLDVQGTVARYLPEFVPPYDLAEDSLWSARSEIAVHHLLAHNSGLPAYERFFLRARTRAEVMEQALALPLEEPPGQRTLYSDIGFILLGEVLERLAKEPLDSFCVREIFQPLGMTDTCFKPARAIWDRIAPTEMDTSFRQRLIHGEVQDENAWVMGGVAGHAGLFSTARDLAAFCQLMLGGGKSKEQQLIQTATIREFTRAWPAREGAPRGLGWDKPSSPSSSGRYFSPSSYGHLGYTGTSLWIDPEKQLFIVFLTNRVHPDRTNDAIQAIRPAVHDAVIEAVTG